MFPLRVAGLRFAPEGRAILDGLDLELSGEGISVILGPNGAGKTLLLRLLAGLLPQNGGTIAWGDAKQPSGRLAMVFQQPMLLRLSVFTNVEFALRPQALDAAGRRARTSEVLERVGLAHRARDCARLLSGGERQRLALARAWAMRPRLLLLDEPTASLDPSATEQVERIIREIRTDGAKVLMTTHNLGQATRLADDIVFLQGELPWRIAFDR
jgi:tungstate transport system ATP-binding protein